MRITDESLLLEAIRGDDYSFSELARRWENKIFGFVFRYNGNREDSQDIVQSTFIKAHKNLDKLQDTGRFSAWLYRIALNECRIGFRTSNRIRGREVSFESHDDAFSAAAVDQGVTTITPEQVLAGKEELNRLGEAFYRLPGEQREVILMREYQGLRFREIAEVLDVPVSTVKSRLYLGLKTLRKFMEETR
jgi:RNA polymerase sigma-70 factor (ECF subfamily)